MFFSKYLHFCGILMVQRVSFKNICWDLSWDQNIKGPFLIIKHASSRWVVDSEPSSVLSINF